MDSKKKRALISVFDKTGVIELAKGLTDLGYEIVSTGGTFKTLVAAGIEVTTVSTVTDFPECFKGRLKTLHPKIMGGILPTNSLEDLAKMKELGLDRIDLVVCNLYPFEKTVANPDADDDLIIENIDIGGPSMVRAAAKNYKVVSVVCDPSDYPSILEALQKGGIGINKRRCLAQKVFKMTAKYDTAINEYHESNNPYGSQEKV